MHFSPVTLDALSGTTPSFLLSSCVTHGFTLIGARSVTTYIGGMGEVAIPEESEEATASGTAEVSACDTALRGRESKRIGVDQLIAERRAPRFALTREFVHLWLLARYAWSRGVRPWLGIATALACVLVAVFLHFHILRPELWHSGDVYAALPL